MLSLSEGDETFIAAHRADRLLATIAQHRGRNVKECEALGSQLAVLHNRGDIDLVAAFQALKRGAGEPDFFPTRRIFEKALPLINAPTVSVIGLVQKLYRGAGNDLMAGSIIEGLIGFCDKSAARVQEAMIAIEASPDELGSLLTAVASVGFSKDRSQYLAEAIRLSSAKSNALRSQAVFCIGRLSPLDNGMTDEALAALERSAAAEEEDEVLAGITSAALEFLRRSLDANLENRVLRFLANALKKGKELTLHACSEGFGFHTANLSSKAHGICLEHLLRTLPTSKGTLDNIDFGISNLITSGDSERAVDFLETLLHQADGKLTVATFGGASAALRADAKLLSRTVTRWLLLGNRATCESVHELLSGNQDEPTEVELDAAALASAQHVHFIFLARKSIGYLFLQPVTAASIVISLMRIAAEDVQLREGMAQYLFNPLILNYTGSVRDYVARRIEAEAEPMKGALQRTVEKVDNYLQHLQAARGLKALYPALSHREAYQRDFARKMAETIKAAEAESVFMKLMSKSIILYGTGSVDYVRYGGGAPKRMETDLKDISTKMEVPRMQQIDPFGLDYMLRQFRAEQWR